MLSAHDQQQQRQAVEAAAVRKGSRQDVGGGRAQETIAYSRRRGKRPKRANANHVSDAHLTCASCRARQPPAAADLTAYCTAAPAGWSPVSLALIATRTGAARTEEKNLYTSYEGQLWRAAHLQAILALPSNLLRLTVRDGRGDMCRGAT